MTNTKVPDVLLTSQVVHHAFGRTLLNVNARQRTSGKLIQH
jgi:hypothetical protein